MTKVSFRNTPITSGLYDSIKKTVIATCVTYQLRSITSLLLDVTDSYILIYHTKQENCRKL